MTTYVVQSSVVMLFTGWLGDPSVVVREFDDGELQCNCENWQRNGSCAHIAWPSQFRIQFDLRELRKHKVADGDFAKALKNNARYFDFSVDIKT